MHDGLGWEVMERMCMFEGMSEEWLTGPPEGTNSQCATDVVVPSGISGGIAQTSEVRARDSESLFPFKSGAPLECLASHP